MQSINKQFYGYECWFVLCQVAYMCVMCVLGVQELPIA